MEVEAASCRFFMNDQRLEAAAKLRPVCKIARAVAAYLLLACFVAFMGSGARAADEDALQELWKQQVAKPDDHDALIKACHEFAAAHASDPFLPIARGLEEWHLLRSNKREDALQLMIADLTPAAGPVNAGAQRLAMGWMSRVDREQVAAALQAYYRKEVAYPKTLDLVRPIAQFPPTDRFGKPWTYKLTGFGKVPGFTDQKYSLQSATLGDVSEFKEAVQLPYASRIVAVPLQVLPAAANTQVVKFKMGGSTAALGTGQGAGDLFLAYVGEHIIVVCDYTHWKILPRP
jgi:hypothetical protein